MIYLHSICTKLSQAGQHHRSQFFLIRRVYATQTNAHWIAKCTVQFPTLKEIILLHLLLNSVRNSVFQSVKLWTTAGRSQTHVAINKAHRVTCRQNLNWAQKHACMLIRSCVKEKNITISFYSYAVVLTLATIAVLAPSRAAMTHWFAPLPPKPIKNLSPWTVSPALGSRGTKL